jgi:hypothetical protein
MRFFLTEVQKEAILLLMKTLKLTTTSDDKVLLNWENVEFIKKTRDTFGNEFTEVHTLGTNVLAVKESLSDIGEDLDLKE